MSAVLPFTPAHVSALATRAAELERIGEAEHDPNALVRAARLYTLAVRIADDIDDREALPFLQSDLARARDELRILAAETASQVTHAGQPGEAHHADSATAEVTRLFREIALRIEQRLTTQDEGMTA